MSIALFQSTKLVSLYDEVRPAIPRVPKPTVLRVARHVARQFFERTNAWRCDLEYLPLIDGVYRYSLPVTLYGHNVTLNRVLALNVGTCKLEPASEQMLATRYGTWRQATGEPRYYYTDRADDVLIAPVPAANRDSLLAGTITVKPSLKTDYIPTDLYTEYQDSLLAGVLAELYKMPDRTWFNGQLAAVHATRYAELEMAAKSHAANDDTPKARTTRYGGY